MFTIQIILTVTKELSWKHVEKRVDMRYERNKNVNPCGADNREQGKAVTARNQHEQNWQWNGNELFLAEILPYLSNCSNFLYGNRNME